MAGMIETLAQPGTLGIAFNVAAALIAVRGAMAVSDRGVTGMTGNRQDSVQAIRELMGQRFDYRWAAFLLLAGFALQFLASAFPGTRADPLLSVTLLIAVGAYLLMRGPNLRHDMATAAPQTVSNNPAFAPVQPLRPLAA